ncbi:Lamin-B receptor, partial [Tetrabaena socialis]
MGTVKKPSKQHFEFFGPHGPAVLVFALPAVCYGLIHACNKDTCLQLWPELQLPSLSPSIRLYSREALLVYLAWFFGLALLHLLLPGQRAQGVVLPDGKRLTYKLN